MNLKMPYGISNYEKIVNDGYYYVDKTMYIEKLENLPETSIIFLRPRKFGKTLFTSVIENYYDKNKTEKFDKLYGNTYIGKNPTKNKNSRKRVHLQMCSIAAFFVELLNSCLIQGI